MEEDGFYLLKEEMKNEEIHLKVNAIHRMNMVILSIGVNDVVSNLIPYIIELLKNEEDEVLFAIAEELGNVFTLLPDKTLFLGILEQLAKHDETVVRD